MKGYCYNCPILLFVIAIIVCRIYKFFIVSNRYEYEKTCMYRKKHGVCVYLHVYVCTLSMVAGIHLGAWNASPANKGGLLYHHSIL